MRIWLFLGALNALIGLIAGAYAWHGMGGDPFMALGSNYQIFHGLALCIVAWLADRRGGDMSFAIMIAGVAFVLGILLFSGTLYMLALTGGRPFPGSAPIGGATLMLGWVTIMVTALRRS